MIFFVDKIRMTKTIDIYSVIYKKVNMLKNTLVLYIEIKQE